jgi:E3 ubiquitin-protein ligase TRIP12
VLREDLTCSKLGSKLSTQLKDVLSICGGGMPAWCRLLVNHAKHLFPFEVRRRYFNCTAFGLGRALQHMQALNAAEVRVQFSDGAMLGPGASL